MKLTAQQSRLSVRKTGLNGVQGGILGYVTVWVRRTNSDGNMGACVHFGEGLEGEPWVHHRVVPKSGSSIKNELVISDRPSLHTTDIAVDDGSVNRILPNRPIIEARPERELSVLKSRIPGGRIPTGLVGEEDRILGLVDDERFRDQKPFFPPVPV